MLVQNQLKIGNLKANWINNTWVTLSTQTVGVRWVVVEMSHQKYLRFMRSLIVHHKIFLGSCEIPSLPLVWSGPQVADSRADYSNHSNPLLFFLLIFIITIIVVAKIFIATVTTITIISVLSSFEQQILLEFKFSKFKFSKRIQTIPQSTYSPQDHYLVRSIPQDREQKLTELIFQTIPALPDTYHH